MSNILYIIMCKLCVWYMQSLGEGRQTKVKSIARAPPKKGKCSLPISILSLLPLSWMVKGLLYRQGQEMKTEYILAFVNVSSDSPYITEHPAVQTLPLAYTSCFNVVLIYLHCRLVCAQYTQQTVSQRVLLVSTVFAHLCICVNTKAHNFHVGVTSWNDYQ